MFFKFLSIVLSCVCLQASQGFFREAIIDPASPLVVLDPLKHPEIERVVQNLRFFGNLSSRPASNIYVHYQAIQNLLVWPTSPTTALSWMLFPISPLPMINPNNIRVSDPLGKITPEQLGKLIGMISEYQEKDLSGLFYRHDQLTELYQLFVKPNQVNEFVKNHKEDELKSFYHYALVDGVNKYVHRNMTPQDEDLNLTVEKQRACETSPHLLVIEAFKHSPSHLLEIPGSEILREQGETWFTEEELTAALQRKYGDFSYRKIEKLHIAATVDMLWKSAQEAPKKTLQLLSYYAWRKFSDQIDKVILASGAIRNDQQTALSHVLMNKFTKADYQALVTQAQASEDIDGLMKDLTEGEQNLILYGGARFSSFLARDYGNVRIQYGEQTLTFANCAEQSLFNLTYLAQLEEQEMGIERNPKYFAEGTPLRLFWQNITDEDLNTTDTRNRWTQTICRRNGVVYRKGTNERTPWTENHTTAHWGELNPGILNQMRMLFHLLGKPEEAAALTYEGSQEETIEAASLKLSQLLSGLTTEATVEDPPFSISPKSELKNLPSKKDWYGKFEVTWHGKPLANWYIDTNHSFLQIEKKTDATFSLDKAFTNPYVMGQLKVQAYFTGTREEYEAQMEASGLSYTQFTQKLEHLKTSLSNFAIFLKHANLCEEHFRRRLVLWCKEQNNSDFYPIAHKIMWGMLQIDTGHEVRTTFESPLTSFDEAPITQKLSSFSRNGPQYNTAYNQACIGYKDELILKDIKTLHPKNRCRDLFFDIRATPLDSTDWNNFEVSPYVAVEVLSRVHLPQLNYIICSFDKNCSVESIKKIAKFLPDNVSIDIQTPIAANQFLALISSVNNIETKYFLHVDNWYQYQNNSDIYNTLPPTQQEFAYELLLPLAKSGRNFDPEIIHLHSDENLEAVYESLRLVAAIHKPMPLMLEDGEA